ncbi:MAG: penicillin-binding protein 1B [Gammaproteobacteria bacterium]
MSRRRKSPRKGRRTSAKRRRRGSGRRVWLKWLLSLTVLGVLLLGGYTVFLAKEVRVKFEGKRWAVPARLYARPLDLYVGAPLSTTQLVHELEALGYRRVVHPKAVAQWSRNRDRFLVRTRAFAFWDGDAPARFLDLRIRDGRLEALADADSGRDLDLVRLEPPAIGSIYPAHREDRVLVRREDLPERLVQALLAVEDRHFFTHRGIDPRGIARALWANVRAGRAVQGGSTLTQQLVKNFFLTPERSLWRKFNEALMALIVERRYDKDEILEAYANEIFLGQDGGRAIHGFGLAARFYFNRPLAELELPDLALLVGLVRGASYYNPRRHPERAKARRDRVLDAMAEQGSVGDDAAAGAKAKPLGVTPRGRSSTDSNPAFVELVRRQLRRDYREEDLTSEGLRIFTTLDPWVQHQAGQALDEGLAELARAGRKGADRLQGAGVVAGTQGGEVHALVGGRSADVAGFNRALDARRPIGSLVKPAVYLAALARPQAYTLLTPLQDRAVTLRTRDGQVWQPQNYDREEHGEVPLHAALARSYNLATVRLGMAVGLDAVVETLHAMGVEQEVQAFPSLLLGALSLSPLEVAQVYQTLASGGYRAPLRAIREVSTADGVLVQRYPLSVRRVLQEAPVFLLTRNLVEVTRTGTGRGLARYLDTKAGYAGKTGTTNDLRDSWFAGYGRDEVAVVWLGRDDNGPTGLTGSSGALPIWGRLMAALGAAHLETAAPDGVARVWVNPATGRLADEGCAGAVAFPFIGGSAPRERDPCSGGAGGAEPGFFERLWR